MSMPRKTIVIILAFIAIYFIWGSTYLLNKIVVTEVAPMYLASIRFTTASGLIFIIAKALKLDLNISKRQFFNNVFAGFLFLVYGNGVFVWALKYVDSGFAALQSSIQPLVVLIMMRLIDGKTIKLSSIIGISLGFIGMYLLISQQQLTYDNHSIIGVIMIFTCVLSWSGGSLFVARANLGSHYFVNTGYQMLSSGILLILLSLILGETWLSPIEWSAPAQLSMGLLITFGSIIAFTSFNYLLKEVSTEKVSTSAYVNPVIALVLGWYVLDEHVTAQSIVAAIIILTGVYFINSKRTIKPRMHGR